MKFFHVVTIVASIIASFVLLGALVKDSAPKQAAAIALGIAAIPYVLMRAVD